MKRFRHSCLALQKFVHKKNFTLTLNHIAVYAGAACLVLLAYETHRLHLTNEALLALLAEQKAEIQALHTTLETLSSDFAQFQLFAGEREAALLEKIAAQSQASPLKTEDVIAAQNVVTQYYISTALTIGVACLGVYFLHGIFGFSFSPKCLLPAQVVAFLENHRFLNPTQTLIHHEPTGLGVYDFLINYSSGGHTEITWKFCSESVYRPLSDLILRVPDGSDVARAYLALANQGSLDLPPGLSHESFYSVADAPLSSEIANIVGTLFYNVPDGFMF